MDAPKHGVTKAGTDTPADPRASLANERTLLAWNRTALALVAGGLAVTQLLHPFEVPGGRRLIGLPLIAVGVALALLSHRRWRVREEAIAAGRTLPPSTLPWLLTLGVVGVAVVAGIIAATGS